MSGNPKDYGALGDGINDDSDAIQTCIDPNEMVDFSFGTYVVTKEIRVTSNRKIEFGFAKIEAKYQATNLEHWGAFAVCGTSASNEVGNVSISGGHLVCYGSLDFDQDGEQPKISLFRIQYANDIRIEDVSLEGGCNKYYEKAGLKFKSIGVVDIRESKHIQITKCRYDGHARTGSDYDCKKLNYMPWTECIFIDSKSSHCVVESCNLKNICYSGIGIASDDKRLDPNGFPKRFHRFVNNLIKGSEGSSISLNSSGCVASGNTLQDSHRHHGIIVGHNGQHCSCNVITGNVISKVGHCGIFTSNKSFNNVISNNIIENVFMAHVQVVEDAARRADERGDDPSEIEDAKESAKVSGMAIRVRGSRNVASANSLRVSSEEGQPCQIAIGVKAETNDIGYAVNNSIVNNVIHGGQIRVQAPYTIVHSNSLHAGPDVALRLGPWARFSSISNNVCKYNDKLIGVDAAMEDEQYEGIRISGNIGGQVVFPYPNSFGG